MANGEAEIVVTRIDKKTGVVHIETKGFVGEGCHIIDQVEQELGIVLNTKETDESYQYINPDFLPNQQNG